MKRTFVGYKGSNELSTLNDSWDKFHSSPLAGISEYACIYIPDGKGVEYFIGVPKENVPSDINISSFHSMVVEYEYFTTRTIKAEDSSMLVNKVFSFWTKDHYEVKNAIPGGIEYYKYDEQGNIYAELVLPLSSNN
ncbi:hypothetical protein [Anaeromicrobium sediminis]|uniref:Bacterial transcription activator effector binding domain-containing protein n=1 Tax=Anaeromicrobium sediminis TaxID=1478221 RepID=A0A267MKT6_9FIRM|nr:hypothetical protein [Anaeromicrobium sediminis]PAB60146.1 hypothetical protein CCE28_07180 [Anaeromicrobium sediminis]